MMTDGRKILSCIFTYVPIASDGGKTLLMRFMMVVSSDSVPS